jgi:plasmid rolling circle replication initiator protein Rep
MDRYVKENYFGKAKSDKYLENEYMRDCMKHWTMEIYQKNKVADVKKIWRCKNKFCFNCRVVDVAKKIENFLPKHQQLIDNGYVPLLLTVTIPNCKDEDLKSTIEQLFKNYSKMIELMSRKIEKGGYKDRPYRIEAALAVLEINRNSDRNDWQPHIHSLIYIDKEMYCKLEYEKYIKAEFKKKTQKYNYISDMDLFYRCLWTSLWKKTETNLIYDKYLETGSNNEVKLKEKNSLYKCDIREVSDGYILEVIKYTYKLHDISNYDEFCTLKYSLNNFKKYRMYGKLANMKSEKIKKEKEDIREYLQFDEISIEQSHELDYLFTMVRKEKYNIVCRSSLTKIIDEYKLFEYL